MKNAKVLIVGCGELGSRHLQAVASLPEIETIHGVDPREESLALSRSRLSEISDVNPKIQFFWYQTLDPQAATGDLCIVATQAGGRCGLIKEVAEKLGYRKFLIEKVVAQSVAEYQDLLDHCAARDISVWVNCKTRAYGVHQYIKTKLRPDEPIFFSDVGGNHGLGNNGVHAADLFAFYDDATVIIPVASRIEPALLPSKRGPSVFDLGGSLYGTSTKGSDFVLSFSGKHAGPDMITIVAPSGRFMIDHFHKVAFESTPELNWEWKSIPIAENWAVSHMTKKFVNDILTTADCELPTLQDCFPAHEFILNSLLPHFKALNATNDQHCPIT